MVEMRQHTRTAAAVDRDGERIGQVDIVAVDDLETGQRTPAEVVIAGCRDSYSPDEAERIAAGIVEAARIVRATR
ncbi:hypothetical protein JNW88_29740 [Micromonospora sp. ATA32]|nr:hypothetical protein [Micromonospora sp. ATA32]